MAEVSSEGNSANAMVLGVLGVGLVEAPVARFRAEGMTRALCATALAQILVAVVALVAGTESDAPFWPWEALIPN